MRCANASIAAGDVLWNLTPKVHYMQHVCEQAALINPRYLQSYLEEGIVGKLCLLYKSSSNGPDRSASRQFQVLTKYLCGVQLRSMGFI